MRHSGRLSALLLPLLLLFTSACSGRPAVPASTASVPSAPVSWDGASAAPGQSSVSVSSVPDSVPAPSSSACGPDAVSLADFSPLKKYVSATLYCNLKSQSEDRTVRGSYDFNADGKRDAVVLNFSSAPDTCKKSTLTVGGAHVSLILTGIAGIYAVNPGGCGKELALVDYGMDNTVTTYFFHYDGCSLSQLGQADGGIEPDSRAGYDIPEYNFQILADGHGRLISRFGVMRFVSPNVPLSVLRFGAARLAPVPVSLTTVVGRTFTLAMDVNPYFQEGSTDTASPEFLCEDKDKIRLSKGEKITFLSVNPSAQKMACAGVRLSNGKKGLLYFFLHP